MEMDLDNFIKETISQVYSGIRSAMTMITNESDGSYVNPRQPKSAFAGIQYLKFDVALTISDKSGTNVGGKIKVFTVVDAGASGSSSVENVTVSRVSFDVPVSLPSYVITRPHEKSNNDYDPHG